MRSEFQAVRSLLRRSLLFLAVATAGLQAAAQNTLIGWGGPTQLGSPLPVPAPPPGLVVVQVSCSRHGLALLSDGSIMAWGYNSWGQCDVPALPPGVRYVQVSAGDYHSLARRSDGTVVGWGDGFSGETSPPPLPPGVTYTDISAGNHFSLACLSDGSAIGWGFAGGLTQVPALPAGLTYTRVAAGSVCSLALRSDGTIVGFGFNLLGQLNIPALPAGLHYVGISTGDGFSLALRSDGSAVGWGSVGNAPAPPPGVRYVAISAFVEPAVALRSDGQVVTWGGGYAEVHAVPPLPVGQSYLAVAMGWDWCTAIRGTPAHTTRVSVDSAAHEAHGPSWRPSLSADGRYVAFYSFAPDLAPGGGEPYDVYADVFLHDRVTAQTTCITTGADSHSGDPGLSADGRWVVFGSYATNLVPGDTNLAPDVFLHDRTSGTTIRVSVDSAGGQANSGAGPGAISADGRFVAFESVSSNLVPGDTNSASDIFVRDLQSGSTTLVSASSAGVAGNLDSFKPQLSADGRFVALESQASSLVAGDTNGLPDIFVRDRLLGTTARVSLGFQGVEGNGECHQPSISADGRFVAFESGSDNLVVNDINAARDIFVHDRQIGTTLRASVASNGVQGNFDCFRPEISADGRFVAFFSADDTFVPPDLNTTGDVFVHDLQSGATERVSVDSLGAEAFDDVSENPAISGDGRFVAFESRAHNLVRDDLNQVQDIFVRDRAGIPYSPFVSFCPGDGSAGLCPCANNGSTGRGCQNSAVASGARLTASGSPSLSFDSLLFSSADEPATAPSFFVQGSASSPAALLGDGLFCSGGTLRVLYTKQASGGVVTAPGPADVGVWQRSAQLGDVIPIGGVRYYQVLYVDLNMGFCPYPQGALSNVTNGVAVIWGL
jgi:Tol biopolymer transport system component